MFLCCSLLGYYIFLIKYQLFYYLHHFLPMLTSTFMCFYPLAFLSFAISTSTLKFHISIIIVMHNSLLLPQTMDYFKTHGGYDKDIKYLEKNKFLIIRWRHTMAPTNCSHKHKNFTFGFCWYMWSHLRLFLLISSICISFNLKYFI